MAQPYTPPTHRATAFNCPLCNAYTQFDWFALWKPRFVSAGGGPFDPMKDIEVALCAHCRGWLYWYSGRMLIPDAGSAPTPNDDLEDDIKRDYAEAASISAKSPRGAAALLRLCIQKLCKQLGEKGKNIDEDIGVLVKKGLDVRVQKALDTVRVIGNEAVHPGSMALRDDNETVSQLFMLVNAIANDMITQPRLRDELYNKLPINKLEGIAARDGKGPAI